MSTLDDRFGPGSQAALRSANQRRVLKLLKSAGELTQAQVARHTGLAPATVSNIVRELTAAGVIDDGDQGRRRRMLRLARTTGLVVGVDFGHRHVTVAVADLSHNILAERRVPLGPAALARDSLARASALLEEALAGIDGQMSDVIGHRNGSSCTDRQPHRRSGRCVDPSGVGRSARRHDGFGPLRSPRRRGQRRQPGRPRRTHLG